VWAEDATEPEMKKVVDGKVPATVVEARGRARLLHETIHGTLQVVHRDFFDPDDRDRIPSATMEEVFEDLATNWNVDLHWLAVDGKTMNVDHRPRDAFEKKAVAALKSGKEEFEAVEGKRYRRAGAIVLHNVCLKCHVPDRATLENRTAGLVITMPFAKQ
jgi:nicotinamide riboside kinase